VARRFIQLGFSLAATSGTAARFESEGVPVETIVAKVSAAGEREEGVDAVELLRDGKVDLVVNTPRGRGPRADGAYIRRPPISTGGLPDHDRRRSSSRRRHRRPGLEPPHGPQPSGVPRGRAVTARMTRADRTGDVDMRTRVGSVVLANPIMTASGHRSRGGAGRLSRIVRAGCGGGEVGLRRPWAGNPARGSTRYRVTPAC